MSFCAKSSDILHKNVSSMAELSTDFKNALYVAKRQCNIFTILGLGPHMSYPILKPDLKQYL